MIGLNESLIASSAMVTSMKCGFNRSIAVRFGNVILVVLQRFNDGIAIVASRRCNVKNVTRLDGRAAVVNLLGNDLGDRFQVDFLTLDRLPRRRDVRDGVSHDEVDLAETLERQFEEAGAIAAVVRWPDLELEIVQLGIEKGQGLCIMQEDIDVVALAVADLQHHRRAAAERP